jgi:hypothetical protein
LEVLTACYAELLPGFFLFRLFFEEKRMSDKHESRRRRSRSRSRDNDSRKRSDRRSERSRSRERKSDPKVKEIKDEDFAGSSRVEIFSTFEEMGLKPDLLRGMYRLMKRKNIFVFFIKIV